MNTPIQRDEAYANLGPCEDREFELMELVDGALPADRAAETSNHLAACPRCRAYVAELSAIDASLDRALPSPALSPGFDDRLRERITGLTRSTSRAEALAKEESDYARLMGTLRQGLRWRTALNAVAAGSVFAGVLTAAGSVMPGVLASLNLTAPTVAVTDMMLGAVALMCGLAATVALRRPASAALFD